MTMSFKDKVILITGGSSGIGASAAILFAREAANVVIIGRNKIKLSKTAEECGKNGKKPLVITADVTKEAKKIIDETITAFGKLDVLINNAGIFKAGCIADGKLVEAYDEVMDIHVRAIINLTMLAAPYLKATKGNVINISSVSGIKVLQQPSYAINAVSKAAVNHFTKAAALELAPDGVRVNAVSPGPVRTDILENCDFQGTWDDFKSMTAFGRLSEPDEVAELLLFLASDKAKSVTGANYVIDCGFLLK